MGLLKGLRGNWYVWLFPFFAAMICGYLIFQYVQQKGAQIVIRFEDGSGIQAEKTKLRFRGVTIGTVKSVAIAPNDKEVLVTVDLQREAENFAYDGARFWVVLPKVGFKGVSGLETIFEGTYIAALPGREDGAFRTEFKGREASETNENLEDTVAYYLETDNANSLTTGDAVTFRGIPIGSITKVLLSKTAQLVTVQINVQYKFTKLVRTNSVFWRKVAVQANLGLFNSEIKISSLDSLLQGGIEVFTPDAAGPIAKPQTHFNLASAPPKDVSKWNPVLEETVK